MFTNRIFGIIRSPEASGDVFADEIERLKDIKYSIENWSPRDSARMLADEIDVVIDALKRVLVPPVTGKSQAEIDEYQERYRKEIETLENDIVSLKSVKLSMKSLDQRSSMQMIANNVQGVIDDLENL